MPNAMTNASVFLISTLFDLLVFLFVLRSVLVAVRADFFNPVSQIVIKFTQWLIVPLRRLIPNFKKIELASVLVVVALEILKFLLLGFIIIGIPHFAGLLLIACADSLKTVVNLFFYAILLQAILSWIHARHSPYTHVLTKITAPILTPFHRLIPPMGGVDISPIPAMIILQLLIIVLITPLFSAGWEIAFG